MILGTDVSKDDSPEAKVSTIEGEPTKPSEIASVVADSAPQSVRPTRRSKN